METQYYRGNAYGRMYRVRGDVVDVRDKNGKWSPSVVPAWMIEASPSGWTRVEGPES